LSGSLANLWPILGLISFFACLFHLKTKKSEIFIKEIFYICKKKFKFLWQFMAIYGKFFKKKFETANMWKNNAKNNLK
jgi:hypothetical protein